MSDLVYSASVMCANLGRLEEDMKALEAAGCHELHFDIMDGQFVPNFTLGLDFIKLAKSVCGLPCSAHLMVVDPERYVDRFVEAGADAISIHVEACTHSHLALMRIRDAGASPGIAINPATPLTKMDYLLEFVDRVVVMTVDPGFAGQAIIPSAFERVRILNENILHRKLRTQIEVDGNIDVQNAAALAEQGASIFVLGTSSIFRPNVDDLGKALEAFDLAVAAQRHLV